MTKHNNKICSKYNEEVLPNEEGKCSLCNAELVDEVKQFTTIKVGYTWTQLGTSAEYFTTVYISNKGLESISYSGLYGTEGRIARALREKGFSEVYTPSDFGQMKTRTINKATFLSEKEALEYIKNNIA